MAQKTIFQMTETVKSTPKDIEVNTILAMRCEICGIEITVDEMVHEVPNRYAEMIQMCDRCYKILNEV